MMLRSLRLIVLVLAMLLAAALPVSAVPPDNPNAVPWTQIDSMSPPLDMEEKVAGNTAHLTFRREGTFAAWAAETPEGPPGYWGTIEWTANANALFDRTTGLPAQWTATVKGTQEFSDGIVCTFSNATKVDFDFDVFPPVSWEGNTVAHCDDGSQIHGRNSGPLPPTLPDGSDQITFGVRMWPGA